MKALGSPSMLAIERGLALFVVWLGLVVLAEAWLRRTRRFRRELADARAHVGLRTLRRGASGRGW